MIIYICCNLTAIYLLIIISFVSLSNINYSGTIFMLAIKSKVDMKKAKMMTFVSRSVT